MNLVTAGESHGKALVAIIENLPANIAITADYIKYYLNLRASGYGRGGRQKIESNIEDKKRFDLIQPKCSIVK